MNYVIRRRFIALVCFTGVLATLSVVFAVGVVIGHYQLPPYNHIRTAVKWALVQKDFASYNELSPLVLKTDPASLIRLRSPSDVPELRQRLARFIWVKEGLPHKQLPTRIEEDVRDGPFANVGAAKVDRLTTDMEYGINSISYLFYPASPSGQLVIYQQGHAAESSYDQHIIAFFLQRGHYVAFLDMPLQNGNEKPEVFIESLGHLRFSKHDQLKFLESADFNPLKVFLHPVATSLNYALTRGSFNQIMMVGISGGGWITSLYSSIDDRISLSFPVAGTAPMYLRFAVPEMNWGDYEQTHPKLLKLAGELDLYVLASAGKGREQVQIFNKFDPCCYAGIGFRSYESAVATAVSRLGAGQFSVWLDDSHYDHKISDKMLNMIEQRLSRGALHK